MADPELGLVPLPPRVGSARQRCLQGEPELATEPLIFFGDGRKSRPRLTGYRT